MARNLTTNILKYAGMMGSSGLRTGSLVPRANTPQAQQSLYDDFTEAGKMADSDLWSKFNSYMKRPTDFNSMLQLWEDMAMWDLMAAALVEIVDEATSTDENSPATIWYQCNDSAFEDELNGMLTVINAEDIIQSQVYYVAALGNAFEKIEYAPVEGVLGLSFVHPFDVRRYWLKRNRKCVGFKWNDEKPNKDDIFVGIDNENPVERVAISDGKTTEDLWYPWDFLHFRRMYRMRMNEHGEPLFSEAEGIYKKLRIAIDQMVVHRAQVQPDRYAINIDVKDQSPIEQMKTVQRWKQSLRHKLAFGQNNVGSTGLGAGGVSASLSDPQGFQSFYNAWSLDTILWVAKPNGFNHTIEKLQGTQNIPDVYDIELLTDLFYSIIGMPRSWFGPGRGEGQDAPSGKALLVQDMRFLRKIKSIRKPILNCYTWLGYFHALLRKKDIRELDIKAMMPPIGSLEDQMKMELLERQANILDILADVMAKYNLPKEAWVETIFRRYMHLPDEVVHAFLTALPAPVAEPTLEGKKPAPYVYKLCREINEALVRVPNGQRLVDDLKNYAGVFDPKKAKVEEAMRRSQAKGFKLESPFKGMRDMDILVNSYGKDPLQLVRSASRESAVGTRTNARPKSIQEDTNSQNSADFQDKYRQFI